MILTPATLKDAEPEIRRLATKLKGTRREIVEALEAWAAYLEQQASEPTEVIRPRAAMPALLRPPVVVPKFKYVRSDVLLAAFRSIECQHCGTPGHSDPAHSNWQVHGKGKAIKASDVYCASLCRTCHRQLDQGSALSDVERKALWWGAHQRSVKRLVQLLRWPMRIPLPDIETYPF